MRHGWRPGIGGFASDEDVPEPTAMADSLLCTVFRNNGGLGIYYPSSYLDNFGGAAVAPKRHIIPSLLKLPLTLPVPRLFCTTLHCTQSHRSISREGRTSTRCVHEAHPPFPVSPAAAPSNVLDPHHLQGGNTAFTSVNY